LRELAVHSLSALPPWCRRPSCCSAAATTVSGLLLAASGLYGAMFAHMEYSQRSKKLVWPIADVCNGGPLRVVPVGLVHGTQLVEMGQLAGQLGIGRDLDRRLLDCP